MEIVFKEFRDRFVMFVGCLGNRFSDFSGVENKLENKAVFNEKPDLET